MIFQKQQDADTTDWKKECIFKLKVLCYSVLKTQPSQCEMVIKKKLKSIGQSHLCSVAKQNKALKTMIISQNENLEIEALLQLRCHVTRSIELCAC